MSARQMVKRRFEGSSGLLQRHLSARQNAPILCLLAPYLGMALSCLNVSTRSGIAQRQSLAGMSGLTGSSSTSCLTATPLLQRPIARPVVASCAAQSASGASFAQTTSLPPVVCLRATRLPSLVSSQVSIVRAAVAPSWPVQGAPVSVHATSAWGMQPPTRTLGWSRDGTPDCLVTEQHEHGGAQR